MNPWEETWDECDGVISAEQHTPADRLESRFSWEQGTNFGAFGDLDGASPFNPTKEDVARARLAAAAPDLVRVLLEVEWEGAGSDGESCCPSCYADAFVLPARYDDTGKYLGYSRGTHESDCALVAALKKAGVR